MASDPIIQQIWDKIPPVDQLALEDHHGVTSIDKLLSLKPQLVQSQLKGVGGDVQLVLKVICTFLESLDAPSSFTWEGFENFCEFVDNSGDNVLDEGDQPKKIQRKVEDVDPDGYNLTVEELKQMELSMENDPLNMTIRGFSARTLQFEADEYNKKKIVEDSSEKATVTFNGYVFSVKKCYKYRQPNGDIVTVGIRKFTKNEKKAICALVVRFQDTIMGKLLEEQPPIGVKATYEEDQDGVPEYVQVREKVGSEPILPLSALKVCPEPNIMPELLFEPQRLGQPPHDFGFVYENDGTNRGEERGDIQFIDTFAGSGGMHQGLSQVPNMTGIAAVEYWDKATHTFAKNNPETPVFCQKVEDFLEENGPTPEIFKSKIGRTDVLTWCSPCQSFSGSNRDVDHNGEKDLYRKYLSTQFVDGMKVTGALIGVFENVEGIWRRPNVYFLKKMILEFLRAGYQARVRLHRAHVFGDPQARPRLIVYVAKRFVEMPNVVETHGPEKLPYMTAGNALRALDKAVENTKKNLDMPPIPNQEGSSLKKPDKEEDILKLDKPAGTIRCGGRAWHPTKHRAITVRESAALQSYPHYYEFLGTLTDQYKQVGNAVPGMMAKAIGTAISASLRFVYDEELQAKKQTNLDTKFNSDDVLDVDNKASMDTNEPCEERVRPVQDNQAESLLGISNKPMYDEVKALMGIKISVKDGELTKEEKSGVGVVDQNDAMTEVQVSNADGEEREEDDKALCDGQCGVAEHMEVAGDNDKSKDEVEEPNSIKGGDSKVEEEKASGDRQLEAAKPMEVVKDKNDAKGNEGTMEDGSGCGEEKKQEEEETPRDMQNEGVVPMEVIEDKQAK